MAVQHELFETPPGGPGPSAPNLDDSVDRDLADLSEDVDGSKTGDDEEVDDDGDRKAPARKTEGAEESDEGDEETDEEEDREDEEGDEEKDEDEEEDDEAPIGDEEEDKELQVRVPFKTIKAKYPNLFKEFPQLRAAFFEYPKYTEIFADVESAQEAADKAAGFDNLEHSLVNKTDPVPLLATLSENNPKALKAIVSKFPEAVRKVDNDAYLSMATPIIEELLYHATVHAGKTGNKNLQLAARHLSNFVFANGGEIRDISKRAPSAPSEAEKQLEQERASYAQEKYRGALTDVVESVSPEMDKIIKNKMDGLSAFEQKQIVKECRSEIDRILSSDKQFQGQLTNLWKKAAESGYTQESKSRIRRAWLDRARLLAPQIRQRLKQEALSSRGKAPKREDKEEEETKVKLKVKTEKRSFPDRGGRTPEASSRRVLDPKKIDWRKTSDRDILDSK